MLAKEDKIFKHIETVNEKVSPNYLYSDLRFVQLQEGLFERFYSDNAHRTKTDYVANFFAAYNRQKDDIIKQEYAELNAESRQVIDNLFINRYDYKLHRNDSSALLLESLCSDTSDLILNNSDNEGFATRQYLSDLKPYEVLKQMSEVMDSSGIFLNVKDEFRQNLKSGKLSYQIIDILNILSTINNPDLLNVFNSILNLADVGLIYGDLMQILLESYNKNPKIKEDVSTINKLSVSDIIVFSNNLNDMFSDARGYIKNCIEICPLELVSVIDDVYNDRQIKPEHLEYMKDATNLLVQIGVDHNNIKGDLILSLIFSGLYKIDKNVFGGASALDELKIYLFKPENVEDIVTASQLYLTDDELVDRLCYAEAIKIVTAIEENVYFNGTSLIEKVLIEPDRDLTLALTSCRTNVSSLIIDLFSYLNDTMNIYNGKNYRDIANSVSTAHIESYLNSKSKDIAKSSNQGYKELKTIIKLILDYIPRIQKIDGEYYA